VHEPAHVRAEAAAEVAVDVSTARCDPREPGDLADARLSGLKSGYRDEPADSDDEYSDGCVLKSFIFLPVLWSVEL
jgi:hypothetical protein